ncbi:MAG TPA: DUF5666 domain-containing protein [Sporichthyaceae bacterium]|nr:DUF5666 domain-containing protein [Sporichthyaceae bacterium]
MPGAPPRHLDLAWSSPASPWETPAPLAAPEGATVPALEWADPWPPIRSAKDVEDEKPAARVEDELADDAADEDPDDVREDQREDEVEGQVEDELVDDVKEDAGELADLEAAAPTAETDEEAPVEEAPVEEAAVEDAEAEGYYLESDFDDLAELDEIAFPSPGVPRSTWFLAIAALVAVAFGGGILIQKHHDAHLVDPAALAAAQLQQASVAGAAGPTLTGTVVAVSPTQFTVKDAQGNQHKVAVTDQTPIIKKLSLKDPANGSAQGLVNGSQVIVQGTSDADGTLQASAVVVQ